MTWVTRPANYMRTRAPTAPNSARSTDRLQSVVAVLVEPGEAMVKFLVEGLGRLKRLVATVFMRLRKGPKRTSVYIILKMPNSARDTVVCPVRAPFIEVVTPVATAALTPLFSITV